jgi:Sec-independent protein secretion pathway component TatC
MRYLAILLLAPWLLILCWAYWSYPKSLPQTSSRRIFDFVVLLLAAITAVQGALLGFDMVRPTAVDQFGRVDGGIWQQVLPALYGYGAFTVVLVLATLLRHACWGRRR